MNHLRWRTTLGSGRWPTVRSQVEPWKFYLPAIRLQQRANCLNFKQIFFLPFKLQIAVNILLPQKNQIQMSEKSARSHKLYRTENNHIRFSWIKLNEFCLCFFFSVFSFCVSHYTTKRWTRKTTTNRNEPPSTQHSRPENRKVRQKQEEKKKQYQEGAWVRQRNRNT